MDPLTLYNITYSRCVTPVSYIIVYTLYYTIMDCIDVSRLFFLHFIATYVCCNTNARNAFLNVRKHVSTPITYVYRKQMLLIGINNIHVSIYVRNRNKYNFKHVGTKKFKINNLGPHWRSSHQSP